MPVRPFEREAGWLLPGSLDELLAADHSVRFVAAYVDGLDDRDWEQLGIRVQGAVRGAPSYHPKVLLGAWLWGFMRGVRSARRLEEACREGLSYRWLTGGQCPDHNTLWRFYQAHRTGMRSLFRLTVQTAVQVGLVDLALQAVDGTKLGGNAAKDRTYNQQGLDRLLARTDAAIADLESQNASDDDPPPPRLPQQLADQQALRERVREARAQLAPGQRVNLTDPEAHLMKSRTGYVAGYNAQAIVSPLAAEVAGVSGMLITAAAVTDDPDDHGQLAPMLDQAAETTGQRAAITDADGGYHSGVNLVACAEREQRVVMPEAQGKQVSEPYHQTRFVYDPETDAYTCPAGKVLSSAGIKQREGRPLVRVYRTKGAVCRACPAFGVCTTNRRQGRVLEVSTYEKQLRTHRAWMATTEAKRLYARRKELVEPVFGIIKEAQGGRRLLLRGLEQVRAEWCLLAAAFNLRTLARVWQERPVVLQGARAA